MIRARSAVEIMDASSRTSTSPALIVTGYRSRSEPLVLPRNAAELYTSARPSSVICRAAFSAVVNHPAPGQPHPRLRVRGDRVRLPRARGRGQDRHHGLAGEQADRGVLLLLAEPGPGQGPACHALADPLRYLLAGLAEDALLQVEVPRGGIPGLVRRAVDA